MPSETRDSALRDILHHIDLADHLVAGFDAASFHEDIRAVHAVTRCLGEAI
ncbi:MAG: ribonuclease HepT family protein [Caulobacteraceae bacterium]